MEHLFWLSYYVLAYTYFGYPLILSICTLVSFSRRRFDEDFTPMVTFIMAAYNEQKAIKEKIEATLALEYPKERLEIIVASDASDDNTDNIVREFENQGVRLIRQDKRKGKTAAQNLAVKEAKGEIIVFSDATTVFEKDAIKHLVKHFDNEKIGCVAGVEKFIDSHTKIAKEASFFWNYELFIREKESKLNTMIGVSGCIFAIRKELYGKLPEGLIEDFALPLKVAQKGKKVIQEKEAVAYEQASEDTKDEFIRKARIVACGINVLAEMKELLNPLKYPLLSFQLISHKVLRWLAPVFMLNFFFSNMILLDENYLYNILGILQIIFYGTALLGFALKRVIKLPKILGIVYHFCVVNFAAFVGMWQYLTGEKKVVWEPIRK